MLSYIDFNYQEEFRADYLFKGEKNE